MMKNVLSTGFMVKPKIPAPNVHIFGNATVHAGCFTRPWYGGLFKAAAWCFEKTAVGRAFTATSDAVSCSHCRTRLQRAGRAEGGVTQPVEVTWTRFRLAVELEDRVLMPYPVPGLFGPASLPPPWLFASIRAEHKDLIDLVKAATPADAEVISGLIGLGVERLAAMYAELDGGGHQTAA